MSGNQNEPPQPILPQPATEPGLHQQDPNAPEAHVRPTRFSLIWLIPILVLIIGAYLGWQTISRRGPEITIEFDSADGLTSGQTQVKHKAVGLGTVQGIELSNDLQHVEVRVQMSAQAAPLLTDHAKFWVVRPRLSGSNISGLETLVSGAFIAIDPGAAGGTPETHFQGLDAPPGVRSDEPGTVYTLTTQSIGSIGQGSPVFFRDVVVGEVLGYKMHPDGRGPIEVQAFVKAPYDQFLRKDTRFWDVSGLSVNFNGGNVNVQLESIQALISGGVAFGLPPDRRDEIVPKAEPTDTFMLYGSKDDADNAGYRQQIPFVTYLQTSVKGLSIGSPVLMYGIQVGNVTDVKLEINPDTGDARIRVAMEVQPERVIAGGIGHAKSIFEVNQALVDKGMRAEVDSSNLLTGSSVISLVFVKNAKPVKLAMEKGSVIIPSQPGGLTGITDSISTVADKLAALPIEQIGDNLNDLLAHTDQTVGGPELKKSIVELNDTLSSLDELVKNANMGLTPVMQRLPAITDQLQQAARNANTALAAYGGDSDFHSNLQTSLGQLNQTLRSVRALTDYLNRHPSSLIFGRSHP